MIIANLLGEKYAIQRSPVRLSPTEGFTYEMTKGSIVIGLGKKIREPLGLRHTSLKRQRRNINSEKKIRESRRRRAIQSEILVRPHRHPASERLQQDREIRVLR